MIDRTERSFGLYRSAKAGQAAIDDVFDRYPEHQQCPKPDITH